MEHLRDPRASALVIELYHSRIRSRVLQVRLCGFCYISTSGFGVGAIRASFIAVFAISCTRYRVCRPLGSRLTLNDTCQRYFRFCGNWK